METEALNCAEIHFTKMKSIQTLSRSLLFKKLLMKVQEDFANMIAVAVAKTSRDELLTGFIECALLSVRGLSTQTPSLA
jgi:hypothetical protein